MVWLEMFYALNSQSVNGTDDASPSLLIADMTMFSIKPLPFI